MKKFSIIIIISIILTSCQTAKDAFTLKKRNNSEEFLVEKKSPLVLPPEYGRLPMPKDSEFNNSQSNQSKEVENLINNEEKILSKKKKKNSEPTSIEKSILKNIK